MANVVCASSEFDIFANRPVQTSTVKTTKIGHKPTTAIDQRDLEFRVPNVEERYFDPDMQSYIKGQLLGSDGVEMDMKDYKAGVYNMLHSLFEQCIISLNGTSITHSSDNYNYHALL
jgi:hypothetical protein